jgi:hypothetical protein
MFLKTVIAVTLFTGLLSAAGPNDSDVFSVRSFVQPETKAKVPFPQLFANPDPKFLLAKPQRVARNNGKCAIPLLEAKPPKTNDAMAQFAGPNRNSSGVMPPPLPACKGWN